jgi:hypothetical protein
VQNDFCNSIGAKAAIEMFAKGLPTFGKTYAKFLDEVAAALSLRAGLKKKLSDFSEL